MTTNLQPELPPLRWHAVCNDVHPCPYLDDQLANMPLYYPSRRLTAHELDEQLAFGKRRSGYFFYHTACPNCVACEPTRIDATTFALNATRRRTERKGTELLTEQIAVPQVDHKRLTLFNRHRSLRGLNSTEEDYSHEDMEGFLVNSSCPSLELSLWIGNKLVAASIVDCGETSLSAVYTYFDPDYSHLSLGTYAIIRQLRWAQRTNRRWLYLGMFVARNPHLSYKGNFVPQQRFRQQSWNDIYSTTATDRETDPLL